MPRPGTRPPPGTRVRPSTARVRPRVPEKPPTPRGLSRPSANDHAERWTTQQGQYLAFIYAYTTIHGQAPAQRDMETFFRVTPPSVHTMVKTLEREGWIRRQPRAARSIELLVEAEALPILRRPG